jgi:hypothetical protein
MLHAENSLQKTSVAVETDFKVISSIEKGTPSGFSQRPMSPLSGKAANPRPVACGHRHGVPSRMKPEAPAIRMKQHRNRKKKHCWAKPWRTF